VTSLVCQLAQVCSAAGDARVDTHAACLCRPSSLIHQLPGLSPAWVSTLVHSCRRADHPVRVNENDLSAIAVDVPSGQTGSIWGVRLHLQRAAPPPTADRVSVGRLPGQADESMTGTKEDWHPEDAA
jgi:hypothetical protein